MADRRDETRLVLAAKLALAGFLAVVFALFGVFVLVAPLLDNDYDADPLLFVPIGTAVLGAILMLVGINSRFWKGDE
jgi:hypothetical protein